MRMTDILKETRSRMPVACKDVDTASHAARSEEDK